MASWFKGAPAQLPSATENEVQEDFATKGPYGLEVCHDGGHQAIADIVFVHGLTGNRHNTWTARKDGVFWPKDLLACDLPNTRIMTYGYDADIAHFWSMASQNRIYEHAGNLVNAIAQVRERTDSEHRPVLFVTHSLGGLVTEDALLYSKNSAEPHLQDLVRSVVGICFLGTPHCGSDLAKWGSIMGSLANVIKTANVDLVNVLKTDSEVLARVQREFHTMLRGPTFDSKPALKITCFFEELPVRGTGEIVPKHSAILSSYNAIGIRANHMDMTKYNGPNDAGYLAVSGELRRWVKDISNRPPRQGRSDLNVPMGDTLPHPEPNRYDVYSEVAGGYPFDESERGSRTYPLDQSGYNNHHRLGVWHQDSRHYSPPHWQDTQYGSPLPPSAHSAYQGYGAGGRPYAPTYRQNGAEGNYSRPPPPPVPMYIEEAAPMASPPLPTPRGELTWATRAPSTPFENNFSQGGNTIASHNQQTYGSGKTVQGNNMNVSGNVSF